jgi:predicted RNase H-like HicB family nuclease
MKTIDEYSKLPYPLELIPDGDEGGFVAVYPDLPGCISLGDTAQEAVANAADAKLAWLEAALAQGVDIPEPDWVDNYSGQFKLRIPKSLHKSLAEHSKREGISMNQYCLYLLTKNDTEFSPAGT